MRRLVVALVALSMSAVSMAHAEDAGIQVDQVWARATPGAVKSGAIYLTIVNNGKADDQLTAITSPAADHAMPCTLRGHGGEREWQGQSGVSALQPQNLDTPRKAGLR